MSKEDPTSITEAILQYLEDQELIAAEDEGYVLKDQHSGWLHVHNILDEIIGNIAERAQLLEEFQAKLRAHNQYPLFDLSSVIPDFHIDDQWHDKLTFRETLVVSHINRSLRHIVPTVVGGLCLDIQTATGKNPLVRKDPGLEQKLIELLTFRANAARKAENDDQTDGDLSKEEMEMAQFKPELEEFIKSIKPLYQHTYTKFLVHMSSQFDADGCSAGSRITAWVDRNFHTLEEKRTEYLIDEDGGMNEKTLYCAVQPRRYYVKHTSTIEDFEDKKYYGMGKTRDLICEGANFVLMRYLALHRYIGTFELSTMYINGDMCRNIYKCTGPESGLVNGQKLDLCKIYRTIMEECGIVHQCVTVLTLHGQLIKQEWCDCDYILQVNPLAKITDKTLHGNELDLDKIWETDMQLFSEFLDSKTACVMKMKSYLADHPEFKNMMADYVQATLLMKPDDILTFTIKHFLQYYPQGLLKEESANEYVDA